MGANQEQGAADCQADLDAFASMWSDDRKAALGEQLRSSGYPYAEDVAVGVQTRLDDYAEQWRSAFGSACAVSADSAETGCLRARRRDVEQLLSALDRGGSTVAEFAVQAVERLREPESCGGGDGGMLPPPTPPASLRSAVDEFERRLSLATALEDTRQYDAALEEATRVRDEAKAVGYMPTVAEAELLRGRALGSTDRLQDAEDALVLSAREAWAAGHERVALEAAMELVLIAGVENNKPDVGAVWAAFGSASLQRVGGTPRVEALMAEANGALAHRQGDLDRARGEFERALELRKATLPPDHTLVATTHARMAATLLSTQAYTAGLEHADRALEIHRAALGSAHPFVMRAQSLRSVALLQLGRVDEAQTALEEAERIGSAAYEPDDLRLADVHHNLAALASRKRDYDGALKGYADALKIQMSHGGLDNPVVAIILSNLGNVAFQADKYPMAIDYLERSLKARAQSSGPEHPDSLSTLATLAVVHKTQGACEKALTFSERGLAIAQGEGVRTLQRAHLEVTATDVLLCVGQNERAAELIRDTSTRVSENPDLVNVRIWATLSLSDAEHAVGETAASEAAARAALEVASDPTEKAAASFRIARATVRKDRAAALEMARSAQSDASREDRKRIEEFLAQH
jgi:tetratricopeptide (TPR) repeat protein